MSKIKDKKLGAVRIVQCEPVISILRLINDVRCIATENHLLQKQFPLFSPLHLWYVA